MAFVIGETQGRETQGRETQGDPAAGSKTIETTGDLEKFKFLRRCQRSHLDMLPDLKVRGFSG